MAIRFLCGHCKKVVNVKDEFAGKRGKCPHCQKIVLVPVPSARPPASAEKPAAPAPPKKPPAPTTAPPPPPTDAEALAAAALADEPKPEAAAPTAIDFTCPMCDAQLHMPLSEAGKRTPCPECKRIIKVPEPEKRDPANWRQTAPNLPSGAKREVEAAPEGAWGSANTAATVSREALQEAGAVPTKAAPVPLSRRVVRYTLWSAGGVAAFVLAVLGYLKWRDTRAEHGVETALAYAESDAGKAELGAAGRAAIYRLAGEHALRAGQADGGKRARSLFEKGLQAAKSAPPGTERDALLQELALAEVELGGKPENVDAGRKAPWDDVQKDLRATLGAMQEPEPQLEALRGVARRLAEQNEGLRATALANSLFPSANEQRGEALGLVGLELCAAGKKDQAEAAWTQVAQLYSGKERPPLATGPVALATALEKPPPEPAKKSGADAANALVGQVEGLARMKKWDDARTKLSALQGEALLRANVALAAADIDDPKAGNADVTAAFMAQAAPASPWLLLRLARLGVPGKIAADSIQQVAARIADPALRGRAELATLQARLADPKQAGDPKLMDAVEPKTVAAWLARTEWARHNTGSTGVVKGWDGANRAFGLLGLALGEQGGD